MPFEKTEFPDLFIFNPKVFSDARGFFFESFNLRSFESETGLRVNFVQDNQSRSSYGTLRGLHFQTGSSAQAKLVRVLSGKVLDVAVDLRSNSPTYKKVFQYLLSAENMTQLFIPRGFAHGFVVLSETADFFYKCDNYYDPKSEAGLLYCDSDLKIDWKIPATDLILSEKDLKNPTLKDYGKNLIFS